MRYFGGQTIFCRVFLQKPKTRFSRVKKIVFKTKKNVKGGFVPIFTKNINI